MFAKIRVVWSHSYINARSDCAVGGIFFIRSNFVISIYANDVLPIGYNYALEFHFTSQEFSQDPVGGVHSLSVNIAAVDHKSLYAGIDGSLKGGYIKLIHGLIRKVGRPPIPSILWIRIP